MNNVILSACRRSDTKKHIAWRENQMMREILTIVFDMKIARLISQILYTLATDIISDRNIAYRLISNRIVTYMLLLHF